MPLYEYKCKKCGKGFEVLVRSAAEEISCEHCGSSRIEKVFSLFAASGTEKKVNNAGGGCGSCSSGTCGSCSH